MSSGLDSIALAVAHLERVSEENGSQFKKSVEREDSPATISEDTPNKASLDTAAPHHPYPVLTRGVPYGHHTPRIVSVDSMNYSDAPPPPQQSHSFFPGNPNLPHRPHHTHHDASMSSLHHSHYQHLIHQQAYPTHSPSHARHPELMYRMPGQQHGSQPFMMVQVPIPHQDMGPRHSPHMNHHFQHQTPSLPEKKSNQLLITPSSVASVKPNQVTAATTSMSLPEAVLGIASTLDEFFSMELDHSQYPQVPKTSDVILQVQRNDVLLGRGGETNHHFGNIQYRQLVKICQPAYLEAKRRDKPKIAERIVYIVRRLSGRFLKKDGDSSTWRDVGNNRAREKTSQALREGAPELRNGVPNESPSSPVGSSSVKRCHSEALGVPLPNHTHSLDRSIPLNVFAGVSDCRPMNTPSNYGTQSFYSNPAPGHVFPVEVLSESSVTKKSRKASETPIKEISMHGEKVSSQPANGSVSATVSGDDDEKGLSKATVCRVSDDERSSPENSQTQKRALPRLKLLKQRLQQAD